MMEKITSSAQVATKEVQRQSPDILEGVNLSQASLQPHRGAVGEFTKSCRCFSAPIQEAAQLWARSEMLVSGVREDAELRGTAAIEVYSLSELQPKQVSMVVDGQWVESVTESSGSLKGLRFEVCTPLFRNGHHQIEFEVFRNLVDANLHEAVTRSVVARSFNVTFDNDLWLNSWPKAISGALVLDIGSKFSNAQCCVSLSDQNGQAITQKTSTLSSNAGVGYLRYVEKAERFASDTSCVDVRIEVFSAHANSHLQLRLPVVQR